MSESANLPRVDSVDPWHGLVDEGAPSRQLRRAVQRWLHEQPPSSGGVVMLAAVTPSTRVLDSALLLARGLTRQITERLVLADAPTNEGLLARALGRLPDTLSGAHANTGSGNAPGTVGSGMERLDFLPSPAAPPPGMTPGDTPGEGRSASDVVRDLDHLRSRYRYVLVLAPPAADWSILARKCDVTYLLVPWEECDRQTIRAAGERLRQAAARVAGCFVCAAERDPNRGSPIAEPAGGKLPLRSRPPLQRPARPRDADIRPRAGWPGASPSGF